MLRTSSTPLDLSQTFEGITLNPPEIPLPTTLPPAPSLVRPKPRKPPSHGTLQQQLFKNFSRGGQNRVHSRGTDSGWLTDEIVDGQVDDFDFESNLTKFDKRRDWEEFKAAHRLGKRC
jgi:hypothetical protein